MLPSQTAHREGAGRGSLTRPASQVWQHTRLSVLYTLYYISSPAVLHRVVVNMEKLGGGREGGGVSRLHIRVVVLYKANYKSSPIQVLFFLVVPCNILRPLAAFWTWTNQYWSCGKTGVEEQSLVRPDPQYKGEAGEVSHDQHRFVCVQNAARGLRILCRSPRKNSTINKKNWKKKSPYYWL